MVSQDEASVKIFFSLLRSGLYGTPVPESELPESINWNAVASIARKQTVLGIIIDSIQLLPERLHPSDAIAAKMNKFALGLFQANIVIEKTAARLVEFFKQYGISGVLLKGQGVARYYRKPQMRHSGDIDFYVGKNQYGKAIEVCQGNKLFEPIGEPDDNEHHCAFRYGGVLVEVHCMASKLFSPFHDKKFQKWTVEELEHSSARRVLTVGSTDITLPSVDFDAFYIFYHAWHHFLERGIGLRQICDWAVILQTRASDIDRDNLTKNIRRFGVTGGWRLFACIAVNHLGVSPDKIPLYDPKYCKKSEMLLKEIMAGGNFGFYSDTYLRYKSYGFVGLRCGFEKLYNFTKSFITLFPVIPVEATFLYFSRLLFGPVRLLKKTARNEKI